MTQSYNGTPARIGKTTGTFNTPVMQRPAVPPGLARAGVQPPGLTKRPLTPAPTRMPMTRKRG